MKSKNLLVWDLSEYYKNEDDKNIDKDLNAYQKKAKEFAKNYRGRLNKLGAEEFLKALKELEILSNLSSKLSGFAYLYQTTQMKNPKATALYQKIIERLNAAGTDLLFFGLEYNKLSKAEEKKLLENKKIQTYLPYLKRMRRFKPYELKEDVEKTLLEKDITSGSAWVRFYEEYAARLEYMIDGQKYNDAEISKLCLSPDAALREKAGKEINRVSKENSFVISYIYNMIIKDKAVEDAKRGFKLPMSARNLSEDVSDETVKVLAQTVRDN